ncbi:MAG: hypothetical protein QE487_00015 [Fluviicola sp.]|nr:hypothetical protein [Fluviicola sp.]
MKPIKSTILIAILLTVSGCQSLHIEKRMYRKGYTVFWNKRLPNNESTSEKLRLKQTENKSTPPKNDDSRNEVFTKTETDPGSDSLRTPAETLTVLSQSAGVKQEVNEEKTVYKEQEKKASSNKTNTNSKIESAIKQKSPWLLLTLSITLLYPMIARGSRRRNMRIWAAKNVRQAQFTIGVLTVISSGIAYFLGGFFSEFIHASLLPIAFTTVGGFSILHLYSKEPRVKSNALLGVSMASTAAMFALGAAQQPTVEDPYILPGWAIICWLLLIIVVMLAAMVGIGVLSCQIYCYTGQLALAAIVGWGGIAIIVFFGFWAIFSLFKRESQREKSYAKRALLVVLSLAVLLGILTLISN